MTSQNKFVRVSIGTAISLGLIDGWTVVNPRTVYLLTYYDGKCLSNCSFCSLARNSKSRGDMLSRVIWPKFELEKVINEILNENVRIDVDVLLKLMLCEKTLLIDDVLLNDISNHIVLFHCWSDWFEKLTFQLVICWILLVLEKETLKYIFCLYDDELEKEMLNWNDCLFDEVLENEMTCVIVLFHCWSD